MLAVMEPNADSAQDPVSEFLVTGRTGRRNAMADILGPHATTSSGDLPDRLRNLCAGEAESGVSPTGTQGQSESKGENSCEGTTATQSTTASSGQQPQCSGKS